MDTIPVSGPWITQKEKDYVADAVATAWYGRHNKYHERFERSFAQYVGRKYAISLPSCTAGLHLALAGLGVGPGDEVIVPDVTWIASTAPISYVGASPVFADIEKDTWCLSAASFESRITKRTKAVIVVDLYGGMPDWDAILSIAKKHNIAVIEDSAEAIGSQYKGRLAGNFGDASTFSFHGSKTLTTGEGGMFVTDRDDLYRRAMILRDHGRHPGDTMFRNFEVGFKYKMSSLQAALGLAQLERVDELIERKRQIFHWYRQELRDVPELVLNAEPEGVKNTYWMVTVVLPTEWNITKEQLIERLAAEGIGARPFFYPLTFLPAYHDTPAARDAGRQNPVAYDISPRAVNLPSGLNLDEPTVKTVCRVVRQIVKRP